MTNLSEKVEKYIENEVNINTLRKNCEKSLDSSIRFLQPEEGFYNVWVETLVSSRYGSEQMKEAAKTFGLDFDENNQDDLDSIVYEVDNFANELSDKLNELLNLPGEVYFGHYEADGDYGLFYQISVDKVKELGLIDRT